MEPISAAATIVGVVHTISQVLSAATTFMHDVRYARKEIVSVKKELSSLKVILEILGEDFKDPANTTLPSNVIEQTVGVASNCSKVVNQIGDCIRDQGQSRVTWAASGKAEIAKLQANLEVHKSTLNVTLDLVSMSVYTLWICHLTGPTTDKLDSIILKDIKSDTEQILQDTSTLKQDTFQMQNDIAQILTEISRLQGQAHSARIGSDPSDYVLERYLNDLKTDAETVIDETEYLDNRSDYYDTADYERQNDQNQLGELSTDIPEESTWIRTGRGVEQKLPTRNKEKQRLAPVLFTNSRGRQIPIPYDACQTWAVSPLTTRA